MQQEAYHAFMHSDDDLVVLSPTGTGKTLAYLLPLLERIDAASPVIQSVVVVPSRELAQQILHVVKSFTSPVRSQVLHGGRPVADEVLVTRQLHPHLLIATPGRLLDHLLQQTFDSSHLHTLVLDEFDKLLELGFQAQLQQILSLLPNLQRRILLSATDTDRIPFFLRSNHIQRINYLSSSVEEDGVGEDWDARINLSVVYSSSCDKRPTLLTLLQRLDNAPTMVFFNHREDIAPVFHFLRSAGVACEQYHGGMEQTQRERALIKYGNGSCTVLLATDLAARGLDFPTTAAIIHYDEPETHQSFIHRNGRSTRWETKGRVFVIKTLSHAHPCEEGVSIPSVRTGYLTIEQFDDRVTTPLPRREGHGGGSVDGFATIYIGKGKRHKISKGDVVGLLCHNTGLQPSQIGRIDICEQCSYVAVVRSCLAQTLQVLEGKKNQRHQNHL